MCICINCRWVDRCKAYHSVELQHGEDHLNTNPDIEPIEPIIHISVRDLSDGTTGIEWDVRSCKSFHKDKGRWSRLRPGEAVPT